SGSGWSSTAGRDRSDGSDRFSGKENGGMRKTVTATLTGTLTGTLAGTLAVSALALAPVAAWAHHAFGAEFDPNRPLVLRGPVTKVEWVNPHTWIHIEVQKEDGSTEAWMVEGGTPNTLLRNGLNKQSLAPGTFIVVDGYQAKDRSNRAN